MKLFIVSCLMCFFSGNDHVNGFQEGKLSESQVASNPKQEEHSTDHDVDPNGYLLFCLCMGRLGNQQEHFLGGLAFAKAINRTLILPPFRTYKNVPFSEWFKVEPLKTYHRVILAEDFMETLAPTVWPKDKRIGFCWLPSNSESKDCRMKEGSPFGPFWDGLNVDFVRSEIHQITYHHIQEWKTRYPAKEYPVISMRGAPASFPMNAKHRDLQRYLEFSDDIKAHGDKYINDNFPGKKFIGLHLRNGIDWERSCEHVGGQTSYMASPQCSHLMKDKLTRAMCMPDKADILRGVKNAVLMTRAKVIFVATDKHPMIKELEEHLADKKVSVYHMDPWLPLLDQYILIQSEHFIGNCVSSFTSFVTRARDIQGKSTTFWGI